MPTLKTSLFSKAIFILFFFSSPYLAFVFPKPRVDHVIIEGVKFSPPSLSVSKGDTVIWVNKDFFPHTVTDQV